MNSVFFEKLERKLMPIANFFSKQKHLLSIRDGIVSTLPLTIIGSIFLIIGCPPVDPSKITGDGIFSKFLMLWYDFATKNASKIFPPFNATMGIMALFIVGAISYNLAKRYEMKAFEVSIASTSTFILVVAPITDGGIPVQYLDSKGIILAIFISIISVEIMRFFFNKGFTIKLPEGVPPSVANSFATLIPFVFNLLIIYGVTLIIQGTTGKMVAELWYSVLSPAIKGADTVFFIGPIMLLENALWSFGVHATTVTGPILSSIGLINFTGNANAFMAGQPLPYIYTSAFWSFYLAIGGGGSTLALAIMLLRSKSKHLKSIGKVSIIPSLFNINESMVFGLPIFLNPILFIPFVFAPFVNVCLGYLVTRLGLVRAAVANAPWTTPAPIGALISTLDWRAVVFVIILIVIDSIIYLPFIKMYEKRLLESEELEPEKA